MRAEPERYGQVYKLLEAALDLYSPRTIHELEVQEIFVRPQGLYLNTADGKQYRVAVYEVIRP